MLVTGGDGVGVGVGVRVRVGVGNWVDVGSSAGTATAAVARGAQRWVGQRKVPQSWSRAMGWPALALQSLEESDRRRGAFLRE